MRISISFSDPFAGSCLTVFRNSRLIREILKEIQQFIHSKLRTRVDMGWQGIVNRINMLAVTLHDRRIIRSFGGKITEDLSEEFQFVTVKFRIGENLERPVEPPFS